MKETNIVELFEAAVLKYPSNIAVYSGESTLSYAELNRRANHLAHRIRRSAVGGHPNVALLLDHNEEIIIGILGALKAGRTYVPVDPFFPLERSRKILHNSDATTLVTTRNQLSLAYKLLSAAEREITVVNLSVPEEESEENQGLQIDTDQPAYILYTSGSTGEPKGVMQSHRNIVSFLDGYIREFGFSPSDNVLLTTPYSHTVSVIDMFSALLAGAAVSVYNLKKNFDGVVFGQWLRDKKVTILHTVPTFYRYFIRSITDRAFLEHIRLVILGGEEVLQKDVELYKELFSDECVFVNLYGSSEVILGTFYLLNKDYDEDRKSIPIGYPFEVLKTRVLDENNKEVEGHGIGELYFHAPFLNPVYYKDPKGTSDLMVAFDGKTGEKYVRMGDLVNLLPDGSFQLLGRNDNQIKINGNRVHLSEIEINLDGIGSIEQSAVVPVRNENNDVFLVAYIKSKEEAPDVEKLKEALRKNLPEYMVPSFFVKLDSFPVTQNGKIYRNGLPRISYADLSRNQNAGENTGLQRTLLRIWKSSLGKDDISIHDNFFHLGGNSLIATEIVNKIYLELGVEIELSKVFDHQTVFEMARFLAADQTPSSSRSPLTTTIYATIK